MPDMICAHCHKSVPVTASAELARDGAAPVLFCPHCKRPFRAAEPAPAPVAALSAAPAAAPAGLGDRIRQAEEQLKRNPSARRLSPWTAFLFVLRPGSLLALATLTVVFSVQDLIRAFTAPAPANAVVMDGGRLGWWSRDGARLAADYRAAQPAADSAPEAGGPVRRLFHLLVPEWAAEGSAAATVRGILLLYLGALWMSVIFQTACGMDRFPPWPNPLDLFESFLQPGLNFLAALLACLFPALLALAASFLLAPAPWAWILAPWLLLAGAWYFPVALMCNAMRGRPSAAPRVVLPVYRTCAAGALPAQLAVLLALVWPFVFAAVVEPRLAAWQAVLAGRAGMLVCLAVCARALGLLYRTLEDNLKWTHFTRA